MSDHRSRSSRRRLAVAVMIALTVLTASCSGVPSAPSGGPGMTVTDVLGRQVTLPTTRPKILLDGARLLYTTALLNKDDPTAGVVGWPNDLLQNDPDTFRAYAQRFPRITGIPMTGQLYDNSFSVEQAISLQPDVFVVSAANVDAARDAGTISRLEASGIQTVVVDYFVDPLKNSVPSVRLMGRLMGRQAEAEAFAGQWQSAVDDVRRRLDAARRPPTDTFFWRAPGYYECCSSFAHANLAQLVTFAGGHNLADDLLPAKQGTIAPEAVITRNPPVMIATGANWAPDTPAAPGSFVPLGYQENRQAASAQFRSVVDRQAGFAQLRAVQDRRAFVVWHHFYDSPYNYLAIQWFAQWLHPDLFADVDPDAGVRQLHERFLPIAPTGTFWAGLS